MNTIHIRPEMPNDSPGIQCLYEKGFPNSCEGKIVDKLSHNCPDYHGWVAIAPQDSGLIVGHILLTPAELKPTDHSDSIVGFGLAPLVVHPDFRRQGIGSNLVHQALNKAQFLHKVFVVVLGEPDYYHRFGFVAASTWDLHCEFAGVPDEAFMVHLLNPDNLQGKAGKIYYQF